MNFMLIFDAIILALAIYLFASAIYMKVKKQIPSMFVPSAYISHCKDVLGYISYVFPKTLLFSIVTFLFGGEATLNDIHLLGFIPTNVEKIINVVFMIAFLIVWIYFSSVLKKAYRKFFEQA